MVLSQNLNSLISLALLLYSSMYFIWKTCHFISFPIFFFVCLLWSWFCLVANKILKKNNNNNQKKQVNLFLQGIQWIRCSDVPNVTHDRTLWLICTLLYTRAHIYTRAYVTGFSVLTGKGRFQCIDYVSFTV